MEITIVNAFLQTERYFFQPVIVYIILLFETCSINFNSGPIVVVTATDLKYVPLADDGLALANTSCKVLKFSINCSSVNETLPIDACTIPAFQHDILLFTSFDFFNSFLTSIVTVPVLGVWH